MLGWGSNAENKLGLRLELEKLTEERSELEERRDRLDFFRNRLRWEKAIPDRQDVKTKVRFGCLWMALAGRPVAAMMFRDLYLLPAQDFYV